MLAKVFRYCDLSWQSLVELKQWLRHKSLDRDLFSNPALRVASATNATGETVAYALIEPVFLVRAVINPQPSKPESLQAAQQEALDAGDLINHELEKIAVREGVAKFLIATHQPGQFLEHKVERPTVLDTMHPITAQATKYLN